MRSRVCRGGARVTEIKRIMEAWARWRVADNDYRSRLGYGANTLGRAMDNMPTNKCTVCNGKGRLFRRVSGTLTEIDCPNSACNNGRVDLRFSDGKINPAFIRSAPAPRVASGDDMSEAVDRVVTNELTERERRVTHAEYIMPDVESQVRTQYAKARRMGFSLATYKRDLTEAHRKVSRAIKKA